MQGTLDIGEVIKSSNTPASKLRYYEEVGLIASVGRNGLRRQFEPTVLDQLAFIKLAQIAGFSLEEIRAMTVRDKFTVDREKVAERAEEIRAQIKELTALQDMLEHVVHCPEDDHFSCPQFQRMLRLATRRRS